MRAWMLMLALVGCGDKDDDTGGDGGDGSAGSGTLTLSSLEDGTGVLAEETALTAALFNHQTDDFDIWLLSRSEGTLTYEAASIVDTMTLSTGRGGCGDFDELVARSEAVVAGLPTDAPVPIEEICGPLTDWFAAEAAAVVEGERLTLGLTAEDLWFQPPRTTEVPADGFLSWRDGPTASYRGWDADACAFVDFDLPTTHGFRVRDGVLSLDAEAGTGSFSGVLDEPDVASALVDASFDFVTCTYAGGPVILVGD